MSPCDRLAPMRLYTLSKRHFVLVFVVFLICFGLTVFIGIAGMTEKHYCSASTPKLGVGSEPILTQTLGFEIQTVGESFCLTITYCNQALITEYMKVMNRFPPLLCSFLDDSVVLRLFLSCTRLEAERYSSPHHPPVKQRILMFNH